MADTDELGVLDRVKAGARKARASITESTESVLQLLQSQQEPASPTGGAPAPKRKSVIETSAELASLAGKNATDIANQTGNVLSDIDSALNDVVADVRSQLGSAGQVIADAMPTVSLPSISGGNKTFGRSLRQVMENDGSPVREQGEPLVPIFVSNAIVYLEKSALDEPGLFLLSGHREIVKMYKDAVNADPSKVNFNGIQDPLAVATLLIHFFAEMPEPLLTFALYDEFIATDDHDSKDDALEVAVSKLPRENLKLLVVLVAFVNKVLKHSDKNKTNLVALSIAFGGALFRSGTQPVVRMAEDAVSVAHVVKRLFESEKELKAKAKQVFHSGRQSVVVSLGQ